MALVFTNQTGNGDSLEWPIDAPFNGGKAQIAIEGTFDGAIIEIHVDQDNDGGESSYIKLIGVDQTAPDVNEIKLARGNRVKLVLTNAGAGTDITAGIVNV